jgi:hypothetical protein
MQGRWYEKLHQWEKALDMYDMQQAQNNQSRLDIAQHRMRCLEALGEWSIELLFQLKLSHTYLQVKTKQYCKGMLARS